MVGAGSSFFDPDFVEPEDIEEEPAAPDGVAANAWARDQGFPRARIEYLCALIGRGIYDVESHPIVLARKWHMTPARVRTLVGEANRHLEMLAGKNSELASQTIVEKLIAVAEEARSAGSYMAAISGLKAAGEFTIEPRTAKTEISHTYRMMSDSELDAAYAKELKEAQKVAGQLSGKPFVEGEFTEYKENGDRVTPLLPEDSNDPEGDA